MCALLLASAPAHAGRAEGPTTARVQAATAVVTFRSEAALRAAIEPSGARVLRRVPALGIAEVRAPGSFERLADALRGRPGIDAVERPRARVSRTEPALLAGPFHSGPYSALGWQWYATRTDAVPEAVLRAAASVTIAVIDTGADLSAPDLSAKSPATLDLATGGADVSDPQGHGTFVASLAAGSVTNGDGIAGAGGDARLLVIRAIGPDGSFTDVDEARAIVEAVDRGARVINLSFGGPSTSLAERNAIRYASERGVLLVAAAGNEYLRGNPVEYPAALLQPQGSNGQGGIGLSVAAATSGGSRAWFSNTGSWISLAAPGERVLGALSSLSSATAYPRVALPGALGGLYGFGSGTSYAAPQVSGAAALVWGANPTLTASQVAQVLEETAQGAGAWTPELGYGVIDVAAAVARATSVSAAAAPAETKPAKRKTKPKPKSKKQKRKKRR